jgi:hypothetical protein
LLGCPLRRGMAGDCVVYGSAAFMDKDYETNSNRNVAVGMTKKLAATSSPMCFVKNVRQVCDGGFRCLNMYLATVVSETLMPSFHNSP